MTKTETTSTTPKTDSIPTNPFATFDPMAMWTAQQQAFHKLITDAQGRAQAMAEEYAALEAQMVARARQAIETWAQLAQDAISYSSQLTAQARKIGLEAARKINA
jgi:hypothetical protein